MYTQSTPDTYQVYLPQTIVTSDFSEAQTIALTEITSSDLDKTYAMFSISEAIRTIEVTGSILLTLNGITGGFTTVEIKMDVVDASSVSQHSFPLASYDDSTPTGLKDISISQSIDLEIGKSVIISFEVEMPSP